MYKKKKISEKQRVGTLKAASQNMFIPVVIYIKKKKTF